MAKWIGLLMFIYRLYMRVDHVELPQLSMSLLSNNPALYATLLDSKLWSSDMLFEVKTCIAIPILHTDGTGLYLNT